MHNSEAYGSEALNKHRTKAPNLLIVQMKHHYFDLSHAEHEYLVCAVSFRDASDSSIVLK